MKQIILFSLSIYQTIIAPLLHQLGLKTTCRYEKTCSAYAKDVIGDYGVMKGSLLTVKRIASCSPFTQIYATS